MGVWRGCGVAVAFAAGISVALVCVQVNHVVLDASVAGAPAAIGGAFCDAIFGTDAQGGDWAEKKDRCRETASAQAAQVSVGINRRSTAGLGYLQTPPSRSNRTRFP